MESNLHPKKKNKLKKLEQTQELAGNKSGQQFFIMTCQEEGKSFEPYWPYKMFDFLKKICPGTKTKKLRNGSLLIEARASEKAKSLLELETFEDMKIKVELHKTLNYSKGVVTSYDLIHCSEEEILNESRSQGVVEVKRLYKRQFGESKPTPALILTFEGSQPPEKITAGFVSLPVRHYIPSPLRCFKCWSLGHIAGNCTIGDRCKLCSAPIHQNECVTPALCINCNGCHSSVSVDCIKYKKEKRAQEIKVKECISYREALRKVNAETNRPISYAQCVSETPADKKNLEDLVTRLTAVVETLVKSVGKIEENYDRIIKILDIEGKEKAEEIKSKEKREEVERKSDSDQTKEMEVVMEDSVKPPIAPKKRPQTPISPTSKVVYTASPPRKILGGVGKKVGQQTETKREIGSNASSNSSLVSGEDKDVDLMDLATLEKYVYNLRKKGREKKLTTK